MYWCCLLLPLCLREPPQVAFARHLNRYLLGDPFLAHLLPLDSGGGDFLSKFHDGVLMCRLVCLAIPGSVGKAKFVAGTPNFWLSP